MRGRGRSLVGTVQGIRRFVTGSQAAKIAWQSSASTLDTRNPAAKIHRQRRLRKLAIKSRAIKPTVTNPLNAKKVQSGRLAPRGRSFFHDSIARPAGTRPGSIGQLVSQNLRQWLQDKVCAKRKLMKNGDSTASVDHRTIRRARGGFGRTTGFKGWFGDGSVVKAVPHSWQ